MENNQTPSERKHSAATYCEKGKYIDIISGRPMWPPCRLCFSNNCPDCEPKDKKDNGK